MENVRFELMHAPGIYTFLNRPHLITSAPKHLPAEGYCRLIPKICGLWRLLSVGPEYLKILLISVKNFVIINFANRVALKGDTQDQPL